MPVSAIAVMCSVSRFALYDMLRTGWVSKELGVVLTPIVRVHEAGKLRFRRNGWYGDGTSRWEIVET